MLPIQTETKVLINYDEEQRTEFPVASIQVMSKWNENLEWLSNSNLPSTLWGSQPYALSASLTI